MGQVEIANNNYKVVRYGKSDVLNISFKQGSDCITIPIKEASYQILNNGIQITYPGQINGYTDVLQVTMSDDALVFDVLSTDIKQSIKMFYVMEVKDNFIDYSTSTPYEMMEIFTQFVKKHIKKG